MTIWTGDVSWLSMTSYHVDWCRCSTHWLHFDSLAHFRAKFMYMMVEKRYCLTKTQRVAITNNSSSQWSVGICCPLKYLCEKCRSEQPLTLHFFHKLWQFLSVRVFTPINVDYTKLFLQCIVSDYGLDDRAIGIRSQAGAKDFSSSLCVQTGSGAHPASCTMGTGGPFPGDKSAAGAWCWPLTPI
jgi:hypothetical protein